MSKLTDYDKRILSDCGLASHDELTYVSVDALEAPKMFGAPLTMEALKEAMESITKRADDACAKLALPPMYLHAPGRPTR